MKQCFGRLSFLLIMFIAGCTKSELSADDYVKYVESDKNSLSNSKQIGDMNFKLQYCPTEYMLLKELKTDHISPEVVDERKKQNDSLIFFKLRISAGKTDVLNYETNSTDDYYARIQYLSYGFEQDIVLLNGKDSIFPALFHFERTYGVTPFVDFMMAFNTKIKENDDFQILIDDKSFNTGLLQFTFNYKDIQSIPKLKTN